jgi:glycosyltransferase involved in cell wall biosynthesis
MYNDLSFRAGARFQSRQNPYRERKNTPHILMLVIDQCFPPNHSAPASRLHSFAKYWSRLARVSVITPVYISPQDNYTRVPFPLTKWRLDFFRLPQFFPRLLHLAKQLQPDIVFASFPIAWQLLEAYMLASRLGCPLIVDIRDLPKWSYATDEGSLIRRIFNSALKSISHYVCQKATRIVTVTNWLKHDLVETLNYPEEKIQIVRNGSETRLFAKALRVRKEFDLVYSGVLAGSFRDPQAILDYLGFLVRLYPPLKVLFITKMTLSNTEMFLRRIKELGLVDKVAFEKMGSPEELPKRLGRARLGFNSLIPRCETCIGAIGAKEYEYLAAGLPVMGLMDPDYYIESGRLIVGNNAGIFNQDPERLAIETAALLKDPVRLRRMSKQARKVGERFDRKRLAEEYYYKVILPAWQEFNAGRRTSK